MRRSLKLPIASVGAVPRLTIKKLDWERIESEYGKKLSARVRKAIREATKEFVYWEAFERTAQPAKDAATAIKAIKSGATKFSECPVETRFSIVRCRLLRLTPYQTQLS